MSGCRAETPSQMNTDGIQIAVRFYCGMVRRAAHSLENFSGRAQNHSVWAVFTGTLRAVSAGSGVANEVADSASHHILTAHRHNILKDE